MVSEPPTLRYGVVAFAAASSVTLPVPSGEAIDTVLVFLLKKTAAVPESVTPGMPTSSIVPPTASDSSAPALSFTAAPLTLVM